MMMVPFEKWHLAGMNLHEREGVEFPYANELSALAEKGLCATICTDHGAYLGIVAAVPISDDVCEVAVVSTVEQSRYPVVFTKGVREALKAVRPHFSKVQAVGENTPFFMRWFTWLGFSCVGPVVRPEFNGVQMTLWEMGA